MCFAGPVWVGFGEGHSQGEERELKNELDDTGTALKVRYVFCRACVGVFGRGMQLWRKETAEREG